MADIVDRATRSRMMSGIRGSNTLPEKVVRKYLHSAGLRFTLHARDLPARPDIVFRSRRIAVFVHGCFWHRHTDCRFAYMPKTRAEFWTNKFAKNIVRDRRVRNQLRNAGWCVITIWECEVTNPKVLARLAERIAMTPKR